MEALTFCVPRNDRLDQLLGPRRGPALQDPEQPEHRRRATPPRAVRTADRPGPAGPGGRRRAGHLQRAQRDVRAADALPVQRRVIQHGRGVLRRGQGAGRDAAQRTGKAGRRGPGPAAVHPGAGPAQPGRRLQAAPARRGAGQPHGADASPASTAEVRYRHYQRLLGKDSDHDAAAERSRSRQETPRLQLASLNLRPGRRRPARLRTDPRGGRPPRLADRRQHLLPDRRRHSRSRPEFSMPCPTSPLARW